MEYNDHQETVFPNTMGNLNITNKKLTFLCSVQGIKQMFISEVIRDIIDVWDACKQNELLNDLQTL